MLSEAQAPESSTSAQPPASSSGNRWGVAGFYVVMATFDSYGDNYYGLNCAVMIYFFFA